MTRPTILWVTEEVPDGSGAGGGGALRQAALLQHLASRGDIDLLVAGTVTDDAVRGAARVVVEVPVPPPAPAGRLGAIWELAVRRRSLALAASAPAVDALGRVLDERADAYDVVIVHHENLLPLLERCGRATPVLHVFDVKHVRAEQAAAVALTRRRRALWRAEARASERLAAAHLGRAAAVVACTRADLDALLTVAGTTGGPVPRGVVAPNGVDLERFAVTPRPGRTEVLFLGSLDYTPNVDATVWFGQEVWPTVRAAVPEARWTVAGRRPPAEVLALGADPTIDVVADVADPALAVAAADVVVVPIRIGTGSRLKALEGMASARPVVGTTIGLEGLGLEDVGVGGGSSAPPALVADTAPDLAAEVVRVLREPPLGERIGAAGRAHVEARYGWDRIADALWTDLAPVVSPHGSDAPPATVLVCTRGRAELLEQALASIRGALRAGDELLVVEADGDAAAPLVAALGPSARHLVAPVPGKSRQLNLGVTAATHDVIVLTDDDCQVEPGWVAAMASPFTDAGVGAVFGNVTGLSSPRGVATAQVPPGPLPAVTWEYANGAAMAVRRDAVRAVGGYDERLGPGAPVHGEEHDLLLRLLEAGWRGRIADAPAVTHLEWRDERATHANLLTYSPGAGAFVGAALRRAPLRSARLAVRRARYQASLWRHRGDEGRAFGPATSWAFARGLARGLLLRPRRFL